MTIQGMNIEVHECASCGGRGRVGCRICDACHGQGWLEAPPEPGSDEDGTDEERGE